MKAKYQRRDLVKYMAAGTTFEWIFVRVISSYANNNKYHYEVQRCDNGKRFAMPEYDLKPVMLESQIELMVAL